MNGEGEETPDCEFFSPPSGGQGLARCVISVRPGKSILARFCDNCQVRAIRQGAHCRHLRFGSVAHIGLLGQTRVKARLHCSFSCWGFRRYAREAASRDPLRLPTTKR
jgi:hypothetical protein